MDKQKFLTELEQMAKSGAVSEAELLSIFRSAQATGDSAPFFRRLGFTQILYAIGGAIVLLGIGLLITLHWDDLSSITRMIATLGISMAMYICGHIFYQRKDLKEVGLTAFVLSVLTLPLGLFVSLHELNVEIGEPSVHMLVSAVAAALWLLSYRSYKEPFFAGFAILAATWCYLSLTEFLFDYPYPFEDFHSYRALSIGVCYILLAYSFVQTALRGLVNFLDVFGALTFFIAALVLGGYEPDQNFFWEAIYPGLVFGVIFLGIQWGRRELVFVSAAMLMVYIIKLTSEYFSDALGWPLSLVICGLLMIGVGQACHSLNRKYMKK